MNNSISKEATKYATSFAKAHYWNRNSYEYDPSITEDDIIQECLMAAWKGEEEYDAKCVDAKKLTYIHKCLVNHMENFDRREIGGMTPRRPSNEDMFDHWEMENIEDHLDLVDPSPGPEELVMQMQEEDYALGLIESIDDEDDQYIMRLYIYEDMTYEEIGEVLGISKQAVHKRVQGVLQELGDVVNRNEGLEEYMK